MKHLLIVLALAALTLPLFASDQPVVSAGGGVEICTYVYTNWPYWYTTPELKSDLVWLAIRADDQSVSTYHVTVMYVDQGGETRFKEAYVPKYTGMVSAWTNYLFSFPVNTVARVIQVRADGLRIVASGMFAVDATGAR